MTARSTAASGARHTIGVSLQALLIFAIVGLIVLALGPSYKPADFLAGTAGVDAAKQKYSGYAWAEPNVVRAGDYFDLYGCDYDTELGNVLVGFTAGGWGSPLDADGCFEIESIPALSGDTLPAGVYDITISQEVRGRWRVTGSTTITVTN